MCACDSTVYINRLRSASRSFPSTYTWHISLILFCYLVSRLSRIRPIQMIWISFGSHMCYVIWINFVVVPLRISECFRYPLSKSCSSQISDFILMFENLGTSRTWQSLTHIHICTYISELDPTTISHHIHSSIRLFLSHFLCLYLAHSHPFYDFHWRF